MSKIFLNKSLLVICALFIFVGCILVAYMSWNYSFYTKNRDDIVYVDAVVSDIDREPNVSLSDDSAHKYVIIIKYYYNGNSYICPRWQVVPGDSIEDLYYSVGDHYEIAILSSAPDEVLDDDRETIERYLADDGDYMWTIWASLAFSAFIYVISVSVMIVVRYIRKKMELIRKTL